MKMRELFAMLVLSAVVLLAVGCGSKTSVARKTVTNKAATGFSADISTRTEGSLNPKTRMYADGPNKLRTELPQQVIIVRKDKGKIYFVEDSSKEVTEMSLTTGNTKAITPIGIDTSKMKKIGSEKIGGYQCTKYLDSHPPVDSIIWMADDIKIPVKMEQKTKHGVVMSGEMTNIKVGSQPASLFEVPKGYKVRMSTSTPTK